MQRVIIVEFPISLYPMKKEPKKIKIIALVGVSGLQLAMPVRIYASVDSAQFIKGRKVGNEKSGNRHTCDKSATSHKRELDLVVLLWYQRAYWHKELSQCYAGVSQTRSPPCPHDL